MKAIVQDRYGPLDDVLELKDIDAPVVKDSEVQIHVHAASIHIGDWHGMRGEPYFMRPVFGLLKPKHRIPGTDVAGTVEAVGTNATQLQPGDEVFGWCNGAFAEYVCAGENNFTSKPVNLTFEQAAAVPTSAFAALQGLRDHGKLQPGQRVLINGASGGVGTFAVQIAKAFGAEVTGVCSTRNVDMVRSIGADHVIDYTQEDFSRSGGRYDFILDNVGNRSFSDCRRALTPNGTYQPSGVSVGGWFGGMGYLLKAFVSSLFVRQILSPYVSLPNHENLVFLKELIDADNVTPVIDRTYSLGEAPEAIGYVGEGHARAKVVIAI